MTLFRSATHQELWVDRWCHSCFQPDEAARRLRGKDTICPILAKALRTDRKPPEWDRNPRADEMVRTIRCNEYTDKPARNVRKTTHVEEPPMFDIEPAEIGFVPVDGWPDKPKKDEVDHQ